MEVYIEGLHADLKAVHEKLDTKTVEASTDRSQGIGAGSLPPDIREMLNKILEEREARDSLAFAPVDEVKRLSNVVNGKVSWSDFQNGLRRIDEMRVFLETAAEKVFIGHKQFVLQELDKKADAEAVNWGLRAKGDEHEVKALRARVEHLERLQGALFRDVECIRSEVNYLTERMSPAVVRNTTVCKIMWDLLGLSDPTAKRLLTECSAPPDPLTFPKTPRIPGPERDNQEGPQKRGDTRGRYSASKVNRQSSSSAFGQRAIRTGTEPIRTEQTIVPPGSLLWPHSADSSSPVGKQWSPVSNEQGARRSPSNIWSKTYRWSREDSRAHADETSSIGKRLGAREEGSLDPIEESAQQEYPFGANAGMRHHPCIRINRDSNSDDSFASAEPTTKGESKAAPPTAPNKFCLLPKKPAAAKKSSVPPGAGQLLRAKPRGTVADAGRRDGVDIVLDVPCLLLKIEFKAVASPILYGRPSPSWKQIADTRAPRNRVGFGGTD
uniref:Uncharacterized protein n=1 Tax=Neospora caninum (strain Liverpool) TaxID=572307 RepID=A0A0F7UBT2_NEOCL|nr:TPA: hypothetical protein BN1204_019265 [Neospora caninum Liverpool]